MEFKVSLKENVYFFILSAISLSLYAMLLYFFSQKENMFGLFFYLILYIAVHKIASLLFVGYLKGNAIKINKHQFPDISDLIQKHARALDLSTVPDTYLLQGNGILNAFATRSSGRNFVILYSDVLEVAYQEGIDAVSFIIGHELGHIKRNHLSFLRSLLTGPASWIPFLGLAYSRACEYTCDNIGYSLAPQGACNGILILTAGKTLYKKVNIAELLLNYEAEEGFSTNFAEFFSTHPQSLKRIARLNQFANHIFVQKESLEAHFFISPKIDVKSTHLEQ